MAPRRALLLLLPILLLAAAGAADAAPGVNLEALCSKPTVTDVQSCQRLAMVLPPNILRAATDLRSLAEECVNETAYLTKLAGWKAVEALNKDKTGKSAAAAAAPDKCLENCVEVLETARVALTGWSHLPQDEKLRIIHRNLTAMLREPTGAARPPPLCKTCCPEYSMSCPGDKGDVTLLFSKVWDYLDFTDAVLDELYPATPAATATATATATPAAAAILPKRALHDKKTTYSPDFYIADMRT